MSDSNCTLSQSRIARYVTCPQQYRYDYDLDVTDPNETERYYNFGTALHSTIEDVCKTVRAADSMSDDEIKEYAETAFPEQWESETDRTEYPTQAIYEQDRLRAAEAIRAFFDTGPGIRHARKSVANELEVEFEHEDVSFTGRIDNVLETEDGLHLIDYKTSDIDLPVGRSNYIERHLDGDYYPDRLKPAIQAAVYLEGIRETDYWQPDQDLDFTFYILLDEDEVMRQPSGVDVEVTGKEREMTEVCRDNNTALWKIIDAATSGILTGDYEVDRWADVHDKTCKDCQYRNICTKYLNEVRTY